MTLHYYAIQILTMPLILLPYGPFGRVLIVEGLCQTLRASQASILLIEPEAFQIEQDVMPI